MKVSILVFSGILFALTMGVACAGTYSNNDTFLNVTKIIEPDVGDIFNVTLMVKNIQPNISVKYPLYIVLAIDTSGTMTYSDPEFAITKQAVEQLLDYLNRNKVEYKIAIVSWDDNVDKGFPTNFSNNRQEIENSLDRLKADYTELTMYDYAIIPSVKLFMDTPIPEKNAKKVVIVITDARGEEFKPRSDQGKKYTSIAKDNNIRIYTIVIKPVPLAEEELKKIADETGGKYYKITEISEVARTLIKIVHIEIGTYVENIAVIDVINGCFDVISTTIQPTEKEIGVNNKLIWKISKLKSQETWKVRISLKANLTNVPVELSKTTEYSRIEYTNPDTNKREILPIPAGKVEIRMGVPIKPLKYQLISVDSALSPPNPKIGNEAVVNAIVRNVGMVEANNVKITLYENEKPIDTKVIEKLGPGEVKIEKFKWIAKDANLTVRVIGGSSSTLTSSTQTPTKSLSIPGFEATLLLIAMAAALILVSKKLK